MKLITSMEENLLLMEAMSSLDSIIQNLSNLDTMLVSLKASGANVHTVANIRSLLVAHKGLLDKKGAKHLDKNRKAIVQAINKANDFIQTNKKEIDKTDFDSKKFKRSSKSVLAYFHGLGKGE